MSKGISAAKIDTGFASVNGAVGPFLIVNPQWPSGTSLVPALLGRDASDRVYIVGFDSENHEYYLVRLFAQVGPVDGAADIDLTFGGNGFVPLMLKDGLRVDRAVQIIEMSSSHVTIACEVLNDIGLYQTALLRFLPDGQVDPDFGVDGVALFPQLPEPSLTPGLTIESTGSPALATSGAYGKVLADGQMLLVAFKKTFGQKFSCLIRVKQNGLLDSSYADGAGYLRLTFAGNAIDSEYKLSVDSKDRAVIVCAAQGGAHTLAARFVDSGALDPEFGGTGVIEIRSSTGAVTQPAIGVDDQDKTVISLKHIPADAGPQGLYLLRLSDNGTADPIFNNGRPVEWTPELPIVLHTTDHIAIDEQQRIVLRSVYENRDTRTWGTLVSRFNEQGLDSGFGESGCFVLPGNASFYGGLVIQSGPDGAVVVSGRQDLWKIVP